MAVTTLSVIFEGMFEEVRLQREIRISCDFEEETRFNSADIPR